MDAPVEQLYQLAIREGNAKKPVYEMHKWWARRLGSVFRMLLLLATAPENQSDAELWRRFYEGDNLSGLRLLDPFMGGGTSIIEGTKLKIQTAGVDIDPVAWFVTRQEVSQVNFKAIENELQKLSSSKLVSNIKTLYQTTIQSTKPNDLVSVEADVIYNFWVDIVTCPKCAFVFEAHNHYRLLYNTKKANQVVFCKTCHTSYTLPITQQTLNCEGCSTVTQIDKGPIELGCYNCPNCNYRGRIVDLTKSSQPLAKRWFSIEYLEPYTQQRLFKTPDKTDFARYERAEETLKVENLPIPIRNIPVEGRDDLRPTTHGYNQYHQLFNARQLLCLGWLLDWVSKIEDTEVKEYFLLAFSDALAANNMLCSFAYGYNKLTPLFGLHAYNMITRPVENNVWGTKYGRGSFERCLNKVVQGKKYCINPYESQYKTKTKNLEKIYTKSPILATVTGSGDEWYSPLEEQKEPKCLLLNKASQNLEEIKNNTIDIILTDPPYYNNLAYSELSDFYYAWIQSLLKDVGSSWNKLTTPYNEALYVRQHTEQAESVQTFIDGLKGIFLECNRVLKDEGLAIFTYHHLDAVAWLPLTNALLSSDFVVQKVFPVRSEGTGKFHSTSGTIKWDAVFVCRKSKGIEKHSSGNKIKSAEMPEIIFQTSWSEVQNWQSRLSDAEIQFNWPDSVSLFYAFVLAKLSALSNGVKKDLDLRTIFKEMSTRILEVLPLEAQKTIKSRRVKIYDTPSS